MKSLALIALISIFMLVGCAAKRTCCSSYSYTRSCSSYCTSSSYYGTGNYSSYAAGYYSTNSREYYRNKDYFDFYADGFPYYTNTYFNNTCYSHDGARYYARNCGG